MRIIKLKGNPNIRDIGGVYDDVTIREGMLIRGRTLRTLTPDQQSFLVEDCHIRTIIDLRSQDEREEAPELKIPGVQYEAIAIFERQKDGISHKDNEKKDIFRIYRVLPKMDRIYYDMLHDESLQNIGKVIRRILTADENEYGFYFHCSEGKDRTGLISAILLLILGVSRKEVVKEYLVTNKMSNGKAFRYYLWIKYLRFQPRFARKVGRTFLAKRRYIKVLFSVIDEEYGSLEAFCEKGLGLQSQDIEAFRQRLIIKQESN